MTVFKEMKQESQQSAINVVRQKMAYAGQILRGSVGFNALLLLKRKFEGKKVRGRPGRT